MSSGESGRRRGRKLSDDERALWKIVTKSIRPRRTPMPDEAPEPPPVSAARVSAGVKAKPAAAAPPGPKPPPVLAPLGRRFKQRLARGTDAIDARLDLHGMTQSEAHHALSAFLRRSQARGARTILVITGKGSADAYGGRGVLKRQVPMWLRLPEFRGYVVGFEQAGITHGGEGALYVRLRRAKSE
jgi:DNA-nicking Smr family endonuclease